MVVMPVMRHPDEAISHGMYRAMVEQRNDARAEAERLRAALQRIADEPGGTIYGCGYMHVLMAQEALGLPISDELRRDAAYAR